MRGPGFGTRYFDRSNGTWSVRGVYLKGLKAVAAASVSSAGTGGGSSSVVGPPFGLVVSAMCVSSHLTLFAVTDETDEAAGVVEQTISKLSSRMSALGSLRDLSATETGEANLLVAGVFAAATLAFVAVVVAASTGRGHDHASTSIERLSLLAHCTHARTHGTHRAKMD